MAKAVQQPAGGSIPGIDDVDLKALSENYKLDARIGEGSYGAVFRGTFTKTGAKVAIKKIKIDTNGTEGVPATTIREVTLLQDLDHPNIVKLIDVVCAVHRVYLIFELLPEDLRQLISRLHKDKKVLSFEICREFTRQLLQALFYCHQSRVIHRDLKPANLLVAGPNQIKLSDFGLARSLEQHVQTYTHEVVTLWYRPPELLLGEKHYSPAVDVWAVGVILVEMLLGKALLPGNSEMDQLTKTFRVLGTPSEKTWPGVSALRNYSTSLPQFTPMNMKDVVPNMDENFYSFLGQLLKMNPKERITVADALQHPWLTETQDL